MLGPDEVQRSAKRWGFVGAGRMATALIGGMIRAGVVEPGQVIASDPSAPRGEPSPSATGIAVTDSNREAVQQSDVVVLAVKPVGMPEVMAEPLDGRGQRAPDDFDCRRGADRGDGSRLGPPRLVRVMPNTPALIGEGASASAWAGGNGGGREGGGACSTPWVGRAGCRSRSSTP